MKTIQLKTHMETYAIKRALQLQSEGQISITQVSDNVNEIYPSSEDFVPDFVYNRRWAKRPQVGKMYGTKHLEP